MKKTTVLSAIEKNKRKLAALALAVCLVVAAVLVDNLLVPLEYLWAFASAPSVSERAEGDLRVHFVDVGQGDCTILEFPDGRTMIVDGGDNSKSVRDTVVGYCRGLGIRSFDYALLTHPDTDHAGGLDEVFRCFGAETVYLPYVVRADADAAYAEALRAAEEIGAQVRLSQTYETIVSESEEAFYYLMFLSPLSPQIESSYYTAANAEGADAQAVNDASAVVYLEYAGRSLLLTGDASAAVEDKLVSDYTVLGGSLFGLTVQTGWGEILLSPLPEEIDFLKAGHHGSADSTGEALLSLCSPEAVFISAGAGNLYAHPSMTCIQRIRDLSPGAEIFRTDELGTVILTIHNDGSYGVSYAES